MKTIIILALLVVTNITLCSSQQVNKSDLPQLGKAPVSKIVAAMTLEEKASLVVGYRAANNVSGTQGTTQTTPAPVPAPSLVQGAAGTTFALKRLGITPMVLADGPAGLRISPTRGNDKNTYYCTAFPVGTLLASTWDPELVTSVGKAMGNEVLEYGVDVILGPGMNIHRNPLCGRNFEYYSEDPLIAGKMGAAMVKGIESQNVGTSLKHFAGNNAETNRNSLNTIVSERALREIYLEGFRIAIQEGQPWTVMSSYNLINGVYTSESPDLLTNILRKDWGFKGFVMTDWGGGKDPVAQMKAGNDLLMPGNPNQIQAIIKAVKDGTLDVNVLNKNVERILNILLLSPRFKGYAYANKPDLLGHAKVARQAAAEGMVLLKNSKNALPFGADIKKIAAFGNTSYEIITGGTGSGDVNEAYSISLVEGLGNAGLTANQDLLTLYTNYLNLTKAGRTQGRTGGGMRGRRPIEELVLNQDIINGMVNNSDAAIITIGRNSGEGSDRKNVEGDFKLSESEQQLIKSVSAAFQTKDKKVVVILNIGGVIETASWKDLPDGILLAWQGGQEGGNSIADIITGKVNPSGKIASTFPVKYEDVPSAANFPGKEIQTQQPVVPDQQVNSGRSRQAEVTYEEGIYVGYRYYSTFNVKPSYEFGYGLSYTNFTYSNLKLSSANFSNKITASVDIKNSGNTAGKEIAELYITAPSVKLDKPALELKGFVKTRLLQPGESQTITFTLDSRSLASFDTPISTWIDDPGKYLIKIGASSQDIRQEASFTLAKELIVKKETVSLTPKVKINELKPSMQK